MRKLIPLIIIGIVLFLIYFMIINNPNCQFTNPKYCSKDDDCICDTNPCFLGNKKYYNECVLIQQKDIVDVCLDACGFGPYDIEVRPICDNHECRLAQFNRTTSQRII